MGQTGFLCESGLGEPMLHVWLIPVLVILLLVLVVFFLVVKYRGGTGVRTEGRTVVDKPEEEPPD